jgi:ABC-type antimicrobial peptide transport system permease subunit
MDATLGQAVSTPWFRTVLLAIFAGVALVLAMAGVYGLVSFTVSQRTSELGLRMALGAQPLEIVRLTLLGGLRLTAAGVVLGWVASLALARVVSSMLFSTGARDSAGLSRRAGGAPRRRRARKRGPRHSGRPRRSSHRPARRIVGVVRHFGVVQAFRPASTRGLKVRTAPE